LFVALILQAAKQPWVSKSKGYKNVSFQKAKEKKKEVCSCPFLAEHRKSHYVFSFQNPTRDKHSLPKQKIQRKSLFFVKTSKNKRKA